MAWHWFAAVLLVAGLPAGKANREHKVHNIVLYPDKYSWCVTTPIQQIVASPGYNSVTIDNNVCVGACYSYSIPKTQPAEPGELIGPYCDSCQPARIACYHVNLQATQEGAPVLQKRVQIIEDCACASCDKLRLRADDCDIADSNTLELPSRLVTKLQPSANTSDEDEPELLKMQKRVSADLAHRLPPHHHHHHHHHKHLVDLLEHANASVLGYRRVEDLLSDDSDDVVDRIIPIPQMDDIQQAAADDDDNGEASSAPQHHHLGDLHTVAGTLDELVAGPHGSKVLRPVEKLHIDSDALKANDEGVVISYEDHHHHHQDANKKDNLID